MSLGSLAKARRAAIRNCPWDRLEQGSLEERLPIVGLDRLAAVIAGLSRSGLNRIGPTRMSAAEVTPHEHMFGIRVKPGYPDCGFGVD
jgi:hypothetical protein